MKTVMIHARIEPDMKDQVEQIFQHLGMTTTQAIRLFFQQVALQKGLPFPVALPNETTEKAIEDARAGKLVAFDVDSECFHAR